MRSQLRGTLITVQVKNQAHEVCEFSERDLQIISRYDGLMYESRDGHQILFFKDEEQQNSRAMAVAALRDVVKSMNADVFVQASIAWGEVEADFSETQLNISGQAVEDCLNILRYASERELGSTVVFSEDFHAKLGLSCRCESFGAIENGHNKEVCKLVRYIDCAPLKQVLRNGLNITARTQLVHYRHDEDVVELLRYIKSEWRNLPSDRVVQLIANFKKFKIEQGASRVVDAFVEVVTDVQSELITQKRDFVLASIVAIVPFLFKRNDLRDELRAAVLGALFDPNKRVVANAIEVFAILDPKCEDKIFSALQGQTDNRVQASALLKDGLNKWDSAVSKRLALMLGSRDPVFKASALYVLGEIAQHLMSSNPAIVETDDKLCELLKAAHGLVADSNIMIARQARMVAEKTRARGVEVVRAA